MDTEYSNKKNPHDKFISLYDNVSFIFECSHHQKDS